MRRLTRHGPEFTSIYIQRLLFFRNILLGMYVYVMCDGFLQNLAWKSWKIPLLEMLLDFAVNYI